MGATIQGRTRNRRDLFGPRLAILAAGKAGGPFLFVGSWQACRVGSRGRFFLGEAVVVLVSIQPFLNSLSHLALSSTGARSRDDSFLCCTAEEIFRDANETGQQLLDTKCGLWKDVDNVVVEAVRSR